MPCLSDFLQYFWYRSFTLFIEIRQLCLLIVRSVFRTNLIRNLSFADLEARENAALPGAGQQTRAYDNKSAEEKLEAEVGLFVNIFLQGSVICMRSFEARNFKTWKRR